MKYKRFIYLTIYIIVIAIVGILPSFLPISIMDDSKENWDSSKLTKIIGDEKYYKNTYQNFSEPKNLIAIDLREKDYASQLLLTSLQGLINCKNVTLFLIYRDSDLFWLQQLNKSHGINYTIYNNSYWDLIASYNNTFSGLIIYDHNFIETVNVASLLAGVNDSLIIHQNMVDNFTSIGVYEIVYDLRGLGFNSRFELYSWALNNFNRFATKRMVSSLNPEQIYFRDYIIANKMFTFYLSGGPLGDKNEIDLFISILNEYPANIPVFGWFTDPAGPLGEYESVKILSKSGKYSLCAAIPDLTVFSSITNVGLNQKPVSFNTSSYEIENKVYISVIVSDGDNVNFCADHLLRYWQDPNRGEIPIGITLEPAMFRFFPTCIDYYYQSATSNEYFLAGPSGAGYSYVDLNPNFPEFLNQSKYAMDNADMNQVWILNGYEGYQLQYSKEVVDAYTSDNCNFTGIYFNYHDFPAEYNYLSNDVPVFQSIFVERENELVGKLQSLRSVQSDAPIFVFVGFWAWDFSFTKLKNAVDQLSNDFVFLRPDHFSELYLKSQESQSMVETNQMTTFIITGLIPLVIISGALAVLWIFYKKDDTSIKTDTDNVNLKGLIDKAIFFITDIQLLLIPRYLFYTTILNLFYFLIFLLSITAGIYLKNLLEKSLGFRYTIISSLGISSVGLLLVSIAPEYIFFSGFSLGILFCHQIQHTSTIFSPRNNKNKNRTFVYLLIISSALILLFPTEYYNYLILTILMGSFISTGIGIILILKNAHYRQLVVMKTRHWYLRGVTYGLTLFLLLIPTFSPENLFFHIFWGLNYYPTRLSVSFTLAAIYLGCILLVEYFRVKNIKLTNKTVVLFFIIGILTYSIIPFLVQGVIFFVIINFLYIIGLLLMALLLIKKLETSKKEMKNIMGFKIGGIHGFTSQFLFWMLIGLFINFIPSSIIVADSQDIFSTMGITAISEIIWNSNFWMIFYIPNVSIFIIVPITLILIAYGLIFSFI